VYTSALSLQLVVTYLVPYVGVSTKCRVSLYLYGIVVIVYLVCGFEVFTGLPKPSLIVLPLLSFTVFFELVLGADIIA
jgi:hypothetical protein